MPTHTKSLISTFITHLHLLDFDRLEDWPAVAEELFAAKHAREKQKQRIRCVEWALYRLFEVWNTKEAKNKLQPFFPPYESLRSLNLRAALFRCLSELKKDGTLGREIMIRKTMFDDCRGDRFEELLTSFSTVVLQKVVRTKAGCNLRTTGRLATAPNVPRREQGSLLPLAIAHQEALKALLRRKECLRERYANLQTIFNAKEQELLNRVDDLAQADEKCPLEAVSDRAVQEIRHQFDENWKGDTHWVTNIVEADSRDVHDPLLDTAFSSVWSRAEDGTVGDVRMDKEQGLVQDLTRRVRVQQERLSHWQKIHQDLIDSRPKSPAKVNGQTSPYKNRGLQSPLKFSYTEQYGTNGNAVDGPISPEMKIHHRKLLEYSHRKSKSVTTPRKLGYGLRPKEWVDVNALDSAELSQAERAPWSPRLEFMRCAGTTTSEEGAEVDPNQNASTTGTASRHKEGRTRPPTELSNPSGPRLLRALSDTTLVEHTYPTPGDCDDQNVGHYHALPTPLQVTHDENMYRHRPSRRPDSDSSIALGRDTGTQEDMLAQQIIDAALNTDVSPTKQRTSLMERTRQSMAFSQVDLLLPDPSIDPRPADTQRKDQFDESQCIGLGRSSSLVERTRRSMSLLPTAFPSKGSRMSIHNRRRSKQYPTNQFETPRKQMEDLKEMTPPDVLFSPEADYASVFKSRPKIATSPNASPTLTGRMQWTESRDGEDMVPE
ncbi:MAG: hypothetical protein Q9166_006204 [cf. Caloplaca sp. 2 TL-2023]